MDIPKLLTLDEAVTILHLEDRPRPRESVRHLLRTGQIEGCKIASTWRATERGVEAYLQRQLDAAKGPVDGEELDSDTIHRLFAD